MKTKKIKYSIDENGCHICTSHGPYAPNRYPQIEIRGKVTAVSRYIYEQENGKIPEGLNIRHNCDNVKCINIKHLISGTHQEKYARYDGPKSSCNKKRI